MALFQRYLLRRAHVRQGQNHIGCLALQAKTAGDRADTVRQKAAEYGANIGATRIAVFIGDVGHEYVVRGLHLALAYIRSDPLLATGCQCPFGLGRLQTLPAVDQGKALRLRYEDLDQRGGRF